MAEPATFTATVSSTLKPLVSIDLLLSEDRGTGRNDFGGAQSGELRVKGEEITLPIVIGTVAWFLGKKVT